MCQPEGLLFLWLAHLNNKNNICKEISFLNFMDPRICSSSGIYGHDYLMIPEETELAMQWKKVWKIMKTIFK